MKSLKLLETETKLFVRDPIWLFFGLVFPGLLLLLLGVFFPGFNEPSPDLGGRTYTEVYASVVLVLGLATLALVTLPPILGTYRQFGILRRLRTTPVHPARLLGAQLEVELGPAAWFLNFSPQYYRTHLGYKYHEPWKKRPELKPISGWCSWEACRRNVSQKGMEQVAEFCARHFKPYGLEFVQLDDGFELLPMPVDPTAPIPKAWLEIDPEKFPGIVYHMGDNIDMLIFQSGKIVFTGARSVESFENVAEMGTELIQGTLTKAET